MARRGVTGLALATVAATIGIAVAPAQATFPGPNGQIAFSSSRNGSQYDIWVMNQDGSNQVSITGPGASEREPAWAPHGREIAFTRAGRVFVTDAEGIYERPVTSDNHYAYMPAWSPDGSQLAFGDFPIYVTNSDGSGTPRQISQFSAPDMHASPDWAPGGEAVLFTRGASGGDRYGCWSYSKLTLVDPDGTTQTTLANETAWFDLSPSFSPDGETIVYARDPAQCHAPPGLPDLYTLPLDGGSPTQLTHTPEVAEEEPVWSPDGTKIAFSATVDGNRDIYVMNADGTGRQRLTTDPGDDDAPSWQGAVVRPPGFLRPKRAAAMRLSLVPAFRECTDPNRTHGPPLASGSCSPPEAPLGWDGEPGHATVGSPDANGHPAQSTGHLRLRAIPGDLSTEADEADVSIKLRLTDVRDAANPSAGYPWSLAVPLPLRLTDRRSGCCGLAGTVMDLIVDYEATLQVEALCAPAGAGVGSTCSVTTTYDTLTPGLVREGARAVWQLTGPVQVYDSGSDNYAPTTDDNAVVATQGVFVP